MDFPVRILFVVSAQSILDDHQRNTIAVIDFIQAPAQALRVTRLFLNRDVILLKEAAGITGIFAPYLDVGAEPAHHVPLPLRGQDIIGIASVGVIGQLGDHTAHFEPQEMLVCILNGPSAGDERMVRGLIALTRFVLDLRQEAVESPEIAEPSL